MSGRILSSFFSGFCESHRHLDSLLSDVPADQKSKVARLMGAFLRRPWTLSTALGVRLAATPREFWSQSFIEIKKNPQVHACFEKLWKTKSEFERSTSNGTLDDFPDSMAQVWVSDWGLDAAQKMARLLSQDPATVLRTTRKVESLSESAFLEGRPGYYSNRAFRFKGYAAVKATEAYRSGLIEIQDEGSQVMSAFALQDEVARRALQPHPTLSRASFLASELEASFQDMKIQTVIDACAGSGGKTLAMADWLDGKGRIFAYDIYPKKIHALKARGRRAHETNIQAVLIEPDGQSVSQFSGMADRVLVDAPCSGWGVLRRNPDIKWPRKPMPKGAHELSLVQLQRNIFSQFVPLAKRGGRITFGVCTFQKSETTEQVDWILNRYPQLQLRASGFIGPHECDAFFMASFEVLDAILNDDQRPVGPL